MANKVYKIDETTLVFGSEVGDDVAWSTESILNGSGRQSAHHDLGAGSTARSRQFMYRFHVKFQATPTLGLTCDLYKKTSDGTHHDNDDGTGDIAVSSEDKLKNLDRLRAAICDQAAANIETVSHGQFTHNERHIAFVLFNNSGATITTDVAETKLHLTSVPDQIQ